MAPFSIPAPCIIPLRLPVFGGPKFLDTNTKIQLFCDTYLEYEIFYTLDGTRPQPYAGIVQGNKTIKYSFPFYLPSGKITIKAIAINANAHTMYSSVITRCFQVVETEHTTKSAKIKQSKDVKQKKRPGVDNGKFDYQESNCDSVIDKFDSVSDGGNCLNEAFIGGSEFEIETSNDDSIEDKSDFPPVALAFDDMSDNSINLEESEVKPCDNVDEKDAMDDNVDENGQKDCLAENEEAFIAMGEKDVVDSNFTNNSAASVETQFCCLKCDMTLQHCSSCNKMNAVSSKYCIECGKQLTKICFFCKQHNPSVASFCQYCGKKLGSTLNTEIESCLKVDHAVMAKPQLKNASIQKLPVLIDRYTQTTSDKSPVRRSLPKFQTKQLPRQSPGRGYWHQQLDYICNHLKSHAYNNVEFRKEISEPTLSDFQSACITKDENVTVTVIFSRLVTDKSASEEIA